MTVSIAGCGWYGLNLAKALVKQGIFVKGSTTTTKKLQLLTDAGIQPYLLDLSEIVNVDDLSFFTCDILWICIPPKTRYDGGEEYLKIIKNISDQAKQQAIKHIVLISSTSVYAEVNAEVVELMERKPETIAGKVMVQAEDMLKQQSTFTTTIIRFAGLIGPGRDPGNFFAGKKDIPNGNTPVNLIHLTDCIGISLAIIKQEAFGYTYNACSPDHPAKQNFYAKAAIRLGLEEPEFIDEKKDWKIISSLYVDNFLNYRYQINSLMSWLDTRVE